MNLSCNLFPHTRLDTLISPLRSPTPFDLQVQELNKNLTNLFKKFIGLNQAAPLNGKNLINTALSVHMKELNLDPSDLTLDSLDRDTLKKIIDAHISKDRAKPIDKQKLPEYLNSFISSLPASKQDRAKELIKEFLEKEQVINLDKLTGCLLDILTQISGVNSNQGLTFENLVIFGDFLLEFESIKNTAAGLIKTEKNQSRVIEALDLAGTPKKSSEKITIDSLLRFALNNYAKELGIDEFHQDLTFYNFKYAIKATFNDEFLNKHIRNLSSQFLEINNEKKLSVDEFKTALAKRLGFKDSSIFTADTFAKHAGTFAALFATLGAVGVADAITIENLPKLLQDIEKNPNYLWPAIRDLIQKQTEEQFIREINKQIEEQFLKEAQKTTKKELTQELLQELQTKYKTKGDLNALESLQLNIRIFCRKFIARLFDFFLTPGIRVSAEAFTKNILTNFESKLLTELKGPIFEEINEHILPEGKKILITIINKVALPLLKTLPIKLAPPMMEKYGKIGNEKLIKSMDQLLANLQKILKDEGTDLARKTEAHLDENHPKYIHNLLDVLETFIEEYNSKKDLASAHRLTSKRAQNTITADFISDLERSQSIGPIIENLKDFAVSYAKEFGNKQVGEKWAKILSEYDYNQIINHLHGPKAQEITLKIVDSIIEDITPIFTELGNKDTRKAWIKKTIEDHSDQLFSAPIQMAKNTVEKQTGSIINVLVDFIKPLISLEDIISNIFTELRNSPNYSRKIAGYIFYPFQVLLQIKFVLNFLNRKTLDFSFEKLIGSIPEYKKEIKKKLSTYNTPEAKASILEKILKYNAEKPAEGEKSLDQFILEIPATLREKSKKQIEKLLTPEKLTPEIRQEILALALKQVGSLKKQLDFEKNVAKVKLWTKNQTRTSLDSLKTALLLEGGTEFQTLFYKKATNIITTYLPDQSSSSSSQSSASQSSSSLDTPVQEEALAPPPELSDRAKRSIQKIAEGLVPLIFKEIGTSEQEIERLAKRFENGHNLANDENFKDLVRQLTNYSDSSSLGILRDLHASISTHFGYSKVFEDDNIFSIIQAAVSSQLEEGLQKAFQNLQKMVTEITSDRQEKDQLKLSLLNSLNTSLKGQMKDPNPFHDHSVKRGAIVEKATFKRVFNQRVITPIEPLVEKLTQGLRPTISATQAFRNFSFRTPVKSAMQLASSITMASISTVTENTTYYSGITDNAAQKTKRQIITIRTLIENLASNPALVTGVATSAITKTSQILAEGIEHGQLPPAPVADHSRYREVAERKHH